MYKFDILVFNNFGIKTNGVKYFYNTDDKVRLNDWARHKTKMNNLEDCPQLSSALKVKEKGYSKMMKNGLGYLYSSLNVPQSNLTNVGIFSSGFSSSNSNGYTINKNNFYESVTLFSARKLIIPNYLNEKDEYIAPNEKHENYKSFVYDSLVYSLFNNSSQQSSLRQITYKDKLWDINNEFFWMSKEEILNLANNNSYSDLYNDARTDSDRHVYKLLFGEERIYDKISPDTKLVIDKATELVIKSMPMREVFANDENHLKSWDAGYAQLKLLWKEYYAEDFKEFRELYKNLEDRMRPLVYELGFLMK
jgi:hypothetical protein